MEGKRSEVLAGGAAYMYNPSWLRHFVASCRYDRILKVPLHSHARDTSVGVSQARKFCRSSVAALLRPLRSTIERLSPARSKFVRSSPARSRFDRLSPARSMLDRLSPARSRFGALRPARSMIVLLSPARSELKRFHWLRSEAAGSALRLIFDMSCSICEAADSPCHAIGAAVI